MNSRFFRVLGAQEGWKNIFGMYHCRMHASDHPVGPSNQLTINNGKLQRYYSFDGATQMIKK
jgi:hypothetical protein